MSKETARFGEVDITWSTRPQFEFDHSIHQAPEFKEYELEVPSALEIRAEQRNRALLDQMLVLLEQNIVRLVPDWGLTLDGKPTLKSMSLILDHPIRLEVIDDDEN